MLGLVCSAWENNGNRKQEKSMVNTPVKWDLLLRIVLKNELITLHDVQLSPNLSKGFWF